MSWEPEADPDGTRILIVDDEIGSSNMLTRLLSLSGYTELTVVNDARNAVDAFQIYKPDIVLLDILMPWMDGFEVLKALRDVCGDTYLSVIVITGEDDAKNRMKALDLGVNDFIGKPFDAAEIIMRIRNIMQIRRLHDDITEQNRTLEIRVEERTKELLALQIELLTRLARAAEFRDTDTGTHIVRIGEMSEQLGRLAGLPEWTYGYLRYAAMMHDIGKMGIPDDIMLKRGPLNKAEWELMKTHTLKGGEIMAGSSHEIIRMGESISLTHHEWWDGSGYPNGLAGEAIPLVGRIVAICDVFDALLSTRPYKGAWPVEKIIEEFKEQAGIHYDPVLSALFLQNIQVFLDNWHMDGEKERVVADAG